MYLKIATTIIKIKQTTMNKEATAMIPASAGNFKYFSSHISPFIVETKKYGKIREKWEKKGEITYNVSSVVPGGNRINNFNCGS